MKRRAIIILSVSLVILVGIVCSIYWIASNQSSKKEAQYIKEMQLVINQMSSSIIISSELSSYYISYWDHFNDSKGNGISIRDNEGKSTSYKNITDLIASRVKYKHEEIKEVINEKDSISLNIKKLNNPPKRYSEAYNLLVDMYQLYSTTVDNAKSPSGSYNSFSQSVESLLTEYYKKLEEFNLKYEE